MTGLAAVLHSGRNATGGAVRMRSWGDLLATQGLDVVEVSFGDHRASPLDVARMAPALAAGRVVPEAASWDGAAVRRRLDALAPDVVLLQTARAYQPIVAEGPWRTVLDMIDRLSVSYDQRAEIGSGPRAVALKLLADRHRRFEQRLGQLGLPVLFAGKGDADAGTGDWVPITVDHVEPVAPKAADHRFPYDAVFFGSLSYAPNIEGLRWLASAEAELAQLRILIAGRTPTAEVRELAMTNGWTLVEDFPDLAWLAEQAPVSLAPLRSAAGIQCKVLEAAALGMAQVVTPTALAGLGGELPARIADTPAAYAAAIAELNADPAGCRRLGADAFAAIRSRFTAAAWTDELARHFGREFTEPVLDSERKAVA